MIKSKLMVLLKSLNEEELTGFKRYLNKEEQKGRNLRKLFSYLIEKKSKWNDRKAMKKETAYLKLYGDSNMQIKKLSNLMSDLALLIERFLLEVELKRQPDLATQLTLRMLESRGLDKFFNKSSEQYLNKLELQPKRDINFHKEQFLISYQTYCHPALSKIQTKSDLHNSIHQSLDLFYLSTKMKLNFESLNRSELTLEELMNSGEEFLYQYMEAKGLNNQPSIYIYKRLAEVFQSSDESEFLNLIKEVKENLNAFNAEEQIDLLQSLINFCINLVHKGKKEYNDVVFELYVIGLDQDIWVYKGVLVEHVFMNLVVLSCALDKMDWCKQFIDKYSKYLKTGEENSTKTLANGYYYFKLNEFEEALQYLRVAECENVYHDVTARATQLMCYYELENYGLIIHDFMKSFSEFVRRHKLLGDTYKLSVQNTIKYTRKLLKARAEKDNEGLILKEDEHYINIQWLKDKTIELSENAL